MNATPQLSKTIEDTRELGLKRQTNKYNKEKEQCTGIISAWRGETH